MPGAPAPTPPPHGPADPAADPANGRAATPKRARHPIIRGVCLTLWLGVVSVAAALLAAFLLPLDIQDRSDLGLDTAWVAMMVRTFSYHAIAGLAACLALAALLRAPRLAGVCTVAIIAALALGGASARPGSFAPAARDGASAPPPLKVMTLNLWRGLRDLSRVEALIASEKPDVILFQEYSPEHHRRLATSASLAADYPWIEAQPARDFSGMATYSRLPLRHEDSRLMGARGIALLDASEWERQPCCTIQWQGRDIVVQNIHLPTAPMGRTLLRLHHALLAQMRAWLAQETRPVVMAGDFNCTPTSAQAALVRAAGVLDVHRAVGAGLGTTWGHRLAWPGFRIDHVYVRDLTAVTIRVGPDVGSDHRPVIVLLRAPWDAPDPAHRPGVRAPPPPAPSSGSDRPSPEGNTSPEGASR